MSTLLHPSLTANGVMWRSMTRSVPFERNGNLCSTSVLAQELLHCFGDQDLWTDTGNGSSPNAMARKHCPGNKLHISIL
jgi:hypothetical protein